MRIHIKPDEPRRLYWADKLGMLIMEDMPNTWEQNPRARKAWEATMREVIARDLGGFSQEDREKILWKNVVELHKLRIPEPVTA